MKRECRSPVVLAVRSSSSLRLCNFCRSGIMNVHFRCFRTSIQCGRPEAVVSTTVKYFCWTNTCILAQEVDTCAFEGTRHLNITQIHITPPWIVLSIHAAPFRCSALYIDSCNCTNHWKRWARPCDLWLFHRTISGKHIVNGKVERRLNISDATNLHARKGPYSLSSPKSLRRSA